MPGFLLVPDDAGGVPPVTVEVVPPRPVPLAAPGNEMVGTDTKASGGGGEATG